MHRVVRHGVRRVQRRGRGDGRDDGGSRWRGRVVPAGRRVFGSCRLGVRNNDATRGVGVQSGGRGDGLVGVVMILHQDERGRSRDCVFGRLAGALLGRGLEYT